MNDALKQQLESCIEDLFNQRKEVVNNIISDYKDKDLMGIAFLSFRLGVYAAVDSYANAMTKDMYKFFGV